ncbi:hypothetical protein JX265_009489 [Neoarthrinium moseri]|uniref:JmjC domain-containing protein n=1 Tax=Neoarthrinium moseri TaxID=1658444 RepID=A0A9Q0AMH0_9PEZI|nr:hypothetical protein JX265_009489 [Neoarthrinium moseri]
MPQVRMADASEHIQQLGRSLDEVMQLIDHGLDFPQQAALTTPAILKQVKSKITALQCIVQHALAAQQSEEEQKVQRHAQGITREAGGCVSQSCQRPAADAGICIAPREEERSRQHTFQRATVENTFPPVRPESEVTESITATSSDTTEVLVMASTAAFNSDATEASDSDLTETTVATGSDTSDPTDNASTVTVDLISPLTDPGKAAQGTNSLQEQARCFSLTTHQMGENLVPNLANFIAQDGFEGRVEIVDMPEINWSVFLKTIEIPKSHDYSAMQYGQHKEHGFLRFVRTEPTNVQFPDFSTPPEKPSDAHIHECLRKLFSHPPRAPVPYYVGDSLIPDASASFSWIDNMLHSGNALKRAGSMHGITRTQWLVGKRHSGTPVHCEDARLRSCNITLWGWKLWILISTQHTAKFEALLNRLLPNSSSICGDQFIRHKSIIISPGRLRQEEIDFEQVLSGPGTMIMTEGRQYHSVLNLTDCMAVAQNFLLPGEQLLCENLPPCEECGLYPMYCGAQDARETVCRPYNSQLKPKKDERKRSAPDNSPKHERKLKPRRSGEKPNSHDDAAKWQHYLKGQDKTCLGLEGIAVVSPIVARIALATQSRHALWNLIDITRGSRSQSQTERALLEDLNQKNGNALRCLSKLEDKGKWNALLVALGQMWFAKFVETHTFKLRLNKQDWNDIRKCLGPPETGDQIEDDKLAEWRSRGRKLLRFPTGLFCLIPSERTEPYSVSYFDIRELSDIEVESLKRLLQSDALCQRHLAAGKEITTAIEAGLDIPEWKWEKQDHSVLQSLPEDELIKLLVPT